MNFFAHAFLAAERSADAAFVLGAMLPDLCSVARARPAALLRGALGDGVRFHHASDAVFHAHPAFGARCAQVSRDLELRGVRRGPARGAAHVASELVLDGWLQRERGVPRAYREALRWARELLRESALEPAACDSVALVCERIRAAPLPEAYGEAAFLCERVERALAPRPYLALAVHERAALFPVLTREAALCAGWAPALLNDVSASLLPPTRSDRAPRPDPFLRGLGPA